MVKTKMDRVLELLESRLPELAGASDMVQETAPVDVAPQMNEAVTSEASMILNAWMDTVSVPVEQAEENTSVDSSITGQDTTQSQSDDFENQFKELSAMFSTPATKVEEAVQPQSVEPEVQSSPVEDIDYKSMYEKELERRIELEWENRNANTELKFLKNTLDREGDKSSWMIDKMKELEAELRVANAARTPEQIAPLGQSYLLREETKAPNHKWRAVRDALTLVENLTGISAEDYYSSILRSESPDIPEVKDKSSVTNTVQNVNGSNKKWGLFMAL